MKKLHNNADLLDHLAFVPFWRSGSMEVALGHGHCKTVQCEAINYDGLFQLCLCYALRP